MANDPWLIAVRAPVGAGLPTSSIDGLFVGHEEKRELRHADTSRNVLITRRDESFYAFFRFLHQDCHEDEDMAIVQNPAVIKARN